MTPNPEQLRAFAEDYTAAWCSMDPEAVAAHYAPEGSLSINGGAPAVGRDALAAFAASLFKALPDMKVAFRDLVVDEDRIECHWSFIGTNTGPGGTGNAVRMDGYESWVLDENGLIAASIETLDAEEFARQLAEGV